MTIAVSDVSSATLAGAPIVAELDDDGSVRSITPYVISLTGGLPVPLTMQDITVAGVVPSNGFSFQGFYSK